MLHLCNACSARLKLIARLAVRHPTTVGLDVYELYFQNYFSITATSRQVSSHQMAGHEPSSARRDVVQQYLVKHSYLFSGATVGDLASASPLHALARAVHERETAVRQHKIEGHVYQFDLVRRFFASIGVTIDEATEPRLVGAMVLN